MDTVQVLTGPHARELYALMSSLRDELPDGMWDEVRECRSDYRADGSTDWAAFAEELQQIAEDWGYPL